ncbi:VanZ family protein [Gulbenkiania mobilis]|uniref:VanZ like protein n=1 Tax=Gulbenkiania mobilis TaxID=397457 RepID=A0ABY2CU07_GULMO|nr:VanZ like protein [Gulbenkiania mobilis]
MHPSGTSLSLRPAHLPHYVALITFVVIVFTSFYPFTGWAYSGRPLLEFLTYAWPYYFRLFDNIVNYLVYVPYGFALALTLKPRWMGWLLALLLSTLTSFSVEFGQQFLPERVASNLDIAYNLAGAATGATLAISPLFRRVWHRVWQWRHRYFSPAAAADYGLVVLVVWFLTQLNPAVPLFGVVIYPGGLPQPYVSPLENPLLFLWLIEAGGAMLNLTATLLFATAFLRDRRYIARTILTVLVLAFFLKIVAAGMLLKPIAFFEWINPSVMAGLAAGLFLVWLFTRLASRGQAVGALAAVGAAQGVAALWPLAPEAGEALRYFRWSYGHLENMSALVEFLSRLWPWAATLCLIFFLWETRD